MTIYCIVHPKFKNQICIGNSFQTNLNLILMTYIASSTPNSQIKYIRIGNSIKINKLEFNFLFHRFKVHAYLMCLFHRNTKNRIQSLKTEKSIQIFEKRIRETRVSQMKEKDRSALNLMYRYTHTHYKEGCEWVSVSVGYIYMMPCTY